MNFYLAFLFALSLNWGFTQTMEDVTFEFCPEMNTWPYYRYPNLNEHSFYEIKNHFKEGYSELNAHGLTNNSGITTIQFKINCQGDAGKFKASSCDLFYVTTEMNPMIIDYLLEKAKSLGGWNDPIDDDGNPGNVHKFYSFRIVNGEITEILPK